MGRAPCCSKVGLRRGPWSIKEDTILANFIQQNGEGQWRSLPKKAGLLRCGKSCRLRWMNYLRPGIKRGDISQDEEDLIVRLHGLLGNRWSLIAGRLPGRTDNEIKNYWNTHLLKKLKSAGLNPKPHKDSKKFKKSTATDASGKKKRKQRKNNKTTEVTDKIEKEEHGSQMKENDPPKTKVYLPKPIRISSVFSRTNSYDSLVSSEGSEAVAAAATEEEEGYAPAAWSPLVGLEEEFEIGGDFLGVGCILPLLKQQSDPVSGDVDMWEKVYTDYFHLL